MKKVTKWVCECWNGFERHKLKCIAITEGCNKKPCRCLYFDSDANWTEKETVHIPEEESLVFKPSRKKCLESYPNCLIATNPDLIPGEHVACEECPMCKKDT